MTRPMKILRTRPGRNAFGRGSPTAASYLSSVQDLVQIPKDLLQQTYAVQVLSGSERNY